MRLLVVGADAAGMSGAMAVRRLLPSAQIVAFERGADASYSMCGIPYYLGGEVDRWQQLVARSVERFARDGVEVRIGSEVTAIDAAGRTIQVRDVATGAHRDEPYDALLHATGARAVLPALPGVAEWGMPVRTLQQARSLRALLDGPVRRAVVVGAGYIGLEMVEALVRRGVQTTLIERASQVLEGLDEDMAALVETSVRGLGVDVRLGQALLRLEGEPGGRCRAAVTDAGSYPADLVVLALGARPEVEPAASAGCALGRTGALRVDERLRTTVPGIWAAGDCVESPHLVSGLPVNVKLGTHANKQGKVAGHDIAAVLAGGTGGQVFFPGVAGTAVTRVGDCEIGLTGLSEAAARDAGIETVGVRVGTTLRAGYLPDPGEVTVKLHARRDSGRVVGAQLVGGPGAAKRIDVPAVWCQLGVDVFDAQTQDLGYAPPFGGVWDLWQVAARKLAGQLDRARAL